MSAKEPELLFSSDDDDDDPMDEVVKKNTMANSLSKIINHDKPVEDETNLENSENSENSETSESDSEGTHDDSTASIASIDADLSDADADAVLNTFSKQKNKRIKSKPTLQDIASLEQSYQDMSEDSESNYDSGDDNDNENDTDENYLQKFDDLLRETHMKNHHPDMLDNNVDEIESLVRVVRNSDGIIVDALHKTSPFLTKYEKTRILGVRAKQINQGAKPLIEIEKTIIDGYLIAQLELQKKVIPFIIKRPIPNGNFEFWKLSDLEII
jgi:DNA-directed RNA polymerase subunit K/omega